MQGEFTVDDLALNIWARDMYGSMFGNNRIPQEIKDAWLELCVVTTDIDKLCNF
jgi:hypothetical protein